MGWLFNSSAGRQENDTKLARPKAMGQRSTAVISASGARVFNRSAGSNEVSLLSHGRYNLHSMAEKSKRFFDRCACLAIHRLQERPLTGRWQRPVSS